MQPFPPTVIFRHRRENLKKCSLKGLDNHPHFQFFTYPQSELPTLTNYILLSLNAPPLTPDDAQRGLFLLDATWRYADKMMKRVESIPGMVQRSIPETFRTAYPRRQEDCADPERGLASIEAIFIAYTLLGRETNGLLDAYYWKDQFLEINKNILDHYNHNSIK